MYSLPYLGEQPSKASEALSRAEWWELLFFVKKLEAQGQEEITCLIQQDQGEQVWGRACSGQTGERENMREATDPREGYNKREQCRDSLNGAEMGLKWVSGGWWMCGELGTAKG